MTLEIYQTLFTIFLAATIVLFILSIVLFFVFNIRKIFSIKSGFAIKKSVKELNEINSSEDNRKRKKYKGHSVYLSKELKEDIEEFTDDIKKKNTVEKEKITIPLERSTVPLKNQDELEEEQTLEISQKKNQLFCIYERKIVVFSNKIIEKKN